jgi:hypothetical protein
MIHCGGADYLRAGLPEAGARNATAITFSFQPWGSAIVRRKDLSMYQCHAIEEKPRPVSLRRLLFLAVLLASACGVAGATENGGSVWPVGAESYATAAGVPHAGETMFYEYTCFYFANEFDDGKGHSEVPEFKLRVFALAGKLSHNWGLHLPIGDLGSYFAIPNVYEQVSVAGVKNTKDDLTNLNLVPITFFNHKGIAHWYYELQFESLGTGYQKGAPVNIGEHNVALTPAAAFTLTPHKGAQDIMSRFDYVINDVDHATHYHSGNEFFWQYDAQQEIAKGKASVGVTGYFYQQVTNDSLSGAVYSTPNTDGTKNIGNKGRVLDLGPQVTLRWGEHGALVMKWDHDMLVQNKPRGNGLWFQFGVPFSYLHHVSAKQK